MSLDYLGYELKELKATDNSGGGVFSGYASTWEKDLYDDVIVKGAFEQTLSADFKAGGAGIPIHWQHKDGSPNDVIGETLSAVEDEHGLLITAKLDTDIAEGKRAYDLLKRGLIHQMSIGFLAEKTARGRWPLGAATGRFASSNYLRSVSCRSPPIRGPRCSRSRPAGP